MESETFLDKVADLVARLPSDERQATHGWSRLLADLEEARQTQQPVSDDAALPFGLATDHGT